MASLISEMREVCKEINALDDDKFNSLEHHYSIALSALEEATQWLLENYQSDANAPGSVAVNFMMLMVSS